jgi:hypothetical protein
MTHLERIRKNYELAGKVARKNGLPRDLFDDGMLLLAVAEAAVAVQDGSRPTSPPDIPGTAVYGECLFNDLATALAPLLAEAERA